MARTRSLSTVDTIDVHFVEDGPEPDAIVAGSPQTFTAMLDEGADGRVLRGYWRTTPGTVTDVEADEIFVVLSGAATVTFDDGEVWELRAGSTGVFVGGERTVWSVSETLTKVFQITGEPAEVDGES